MSCWSAKSFVSVIARAVEDHGFDSLGIPSMDIAPQEVGWKNARKEKISVAEKKTAAKDFGEVPSIEAPSILNEIANEGE